jgi:iron complex outermembrane receptor protein
MNKRILLAGAGIAALLATSPAFAQGPAVEEIIVTAQKREQRLQDVPVAVSVVSGDAITNSGAINLEGAQYLVPTLNFRKSGTTINQSLYMRGVGTSTFSIAGEPSISTVVDGVVYSRAGEAFSDLIDVDRLEVLRGPQGTLFGKNTSAGVVNIVTKRPGDEVGGYVEAGYFTGGDEYRVRGAADLPLSDTVKSRFTAFYGNYDGNIRNVFNNERVNGYEHYGARAIFAIDASDDLSFTIIGDYRKADDDGYAELIGTAPTNATLAALPTPQGDKTRAVNQDLVTATEEKGGGISLQADYNFADHTLTYIGSYREYDNVEIRDGDWLPRAYVGFNQLHDVGPQTSDTVTQEVRITSPGDQFFTYVVGAYYSRAETERTFTRNDIVCTSPTPVTGLVPCTTPGLTVTQPTGTATFGSTFKNYALFGQGELNITDEFSIIGGLRYTSDKLSVFHSRTTALAGPGINPSFGPFTGNTSNENVSGKAGISYDITPENTFYATYSRGYKGPAYNVFYNLTATGTNVIDPETADAFEAGLKNTLLDGQLVLNLAGFYAEYHNFQANNPDVVAGVLVTRFTNAGEVSTRGFEAEALFRPTADFNLSAAVAYTDAHVDQFKIPTTGVATGVVPSGTQLAYAPKWKGSLGADYRVRTGAAVDVVLASQFSAQSDQISQFDASLANRLGTTIDGYGIVDVSAALVDTDDRYRVTFQVKNLFDQSFASAITSGGPGGSFRYIIPREADRYYGITARMNF